MFISDRVLMNCKKEITMTKKFKNIGLVVFLAIAPGIMMAPPAPKPVHRETPKTENSKTRENSKMIPQVEPRQQELTAAQKFAIQTRNGLAKTGFSNQGWIDSMAGTGKFETSNGMMRPQTPNDFTQGSSRDTEPGIKLSNMTRSKEEILDSLPSYQESFNHPVTERPSLNVSLQNQITGFKRETPQSKGTPLDKSEITTKNVTLNTLKIERPKETKMIDTKNSENPRDTEYRVFLDKISYQDIRANMVKPRTNGYKSRLDAANDYVNKILIDMGTPDSFFLSARYISKPFKTMVKKFSDAMTKASRAKNQQEQDQAESRADQELKNDIASFQEQDQAESRSDQERKNDLASFDEFYDPNGNEITFETNPSYGKETAQNQTQLSRQEKLNSRFAVKAEPIGQPIDMFTESSIVPQSKTRQDIALNTMKKILEEKGYSGTDLSTEQKTQLKKIINQAVMLDTNPATFVEESMATINLKRQQPSQNMQVALIPGQSVRDVSTVSPAKIEYNSEAATRFSAFDKLKKRPEDQTITNQILKEKLDSNFSRYSELAKNQTKSRALSPTSITTD